MIMEIARKSQGPNRFSAITMADSPEPPPPGRPRTIRCHSGFGGAQQLGCCFGKANGRHFERELVQNERAFTPALRSIRLDGDPQSAMRGLDRNAEAAECPDQGRPKTIWEELIRPGWYDGDLEHRSENGSDWQRDDRKCS